LANETPTPPLSSLWLPTGPAPVEARFGNYAARPPSSLSSLWQNVAPSPAGGLNAVAATGTVVAKRRWPVLGDFIRFASYSASRYSYAIDLASMLGAWWFVVRGS